MQSCGGLQSVLVGTSAILGGCYRLPFREGEVPVVSPIEREVFATCGGPGKLAFEVTRRSS